MRKKKEEVKELMKKVTKTRARTEEEITKTRTRTDKESTEP